MAEEGVDAISPTSITSEKEPEDAPVPPGEESIQVTVVTLSGREVASFLTSSGTRVSSMKKLIQEAGGPDTRLQALSCGGQILDNAQSCSSLGWTADEAVIVTMARVVADVDECLAALLRQDPHKDTKFPQGLLEQLFLLCAQCKDIFLAEPMLLELQPPFVIVGNMHGYYEQLLGLFKR
ncbi:PPZ1, partial [Symbiodinium pilosum]